MENGLNDRVSWETVGWAKGHLGSRYSSFLMEVCDRCSGLGWLPPPGATFGTLHDQPCDRCRGWGQAPKRRSELSYLDVYRLNLLWLSELS